MIGVNLLVCNQTAEHRRATELAVRTLLASDLKDLEYRVVAVDNGSKDDTARWLEGQGIEVVALDHNAGIAVGRNIGYRRLLEDLAVEIVVEIHSDMIFPRLWLLPLLTVLEAEADVGLASASLITPRGTLGSLKVPLDYAWPDERILEVVSEAAVRAYRPGVLRPGLQHPVAKCAAMLRQIGLYDEEYRWSNFEDTDEVYRAAAAGWRYVVVGESVVWHWYTFSRLEVGPDHGRAFRENYQRFLAKWPDARHFLDTYQAQAEAIYR
jgi:GT2 family glycosyltransferase